MSNQKAFRVRAEQLATELAPVTRCNPQEPCREPAELCEPHFFQGMKRRAFVAGYMSCAEEWARP